MTPVRPAATTTDSQPSLVVQKYGGTSVGTADRVRAIADRVSQRRHATPRLVVVLSAMGKTTDDLVGLAHAVARRPQGREMDLLLASGEQVAVSLLGLALLDRGVPAVSLTAAQCGIRTDDAFNIARIHSIETDRIVSELDRGRVVIITGFQGITNTHEVTTLGRGGSDVTAAAVAAALGARTCEIYTDVDGVFSADPRLVPRAILRPEISYHEAIELASSGTKVLHPRAAELCMAYGVRIHVRSSFQPGEGTWILGEDEMVMEQAAVVGVSSDKGIAKVTLLDVPDRPGLAAQVFQALAAEDISVRLIIQSASSDGRGRITFVLDETYVNQAAALADQWKVQGIASEAIVEHDVAKISIVGTRLASTPGLAARMFHVLGREGINIDCISSSEMRIACVIAADQLERAVQAVHNEFFPPADSSNAAGTTSNILES